VHWGAFHNDLEHFLFTIACGAHHNITSDKHKAYLDMIHTYICACSTYPKRVDGKKMQANETYCSFVLQPQTACGKKSRAEKWGRIRASSHTRIMTSVAPWKALNQTEMGSVHALRGELLSGRLIGGTIFHPARGIIRCLWLEVELGGEVFRWNATPKHQEIRLAAGN
jgi:hypothetical protein